MNDFVGVPNEPSAKLLKSDKSWQAARKEVASSTKQVQHENTQTKDLETVVAEVCKKEEHLVCLNDAFDGCDRAEKLMHSSVAEYQNAVTVVFSSECMTLYIVSVRGSKGHIGQSACPVRYH